MENTAKNTKKIAKNFVILFFLALLQAFPALAWNGYDYDNKIHIEIGEGNLVRENNVIQFYDAKEDNYHTAKVLYINEANGGTQIQVEDLDWKKERTFIME